MISQKLRIWSKTLKKVKNNVKKRITHQSTHQTFTLQQLEERDGMVCNQMEGTMTLNGEVIISLMFILPR